MTCVPSDYQEILKMDDIFVIMIKLCSCGQKKYVEDILW